LVIARGDLLCWKFIDLLKSQISNPKYQTISNDRNSKIQTMFRPGRFSLYRPRPRPRKVTRVASSTRTRTNILIIALVSSPLWTKTPRSQSRYIRIVSVAEPSISFSRRRQRPLWRSLRLPLSGICDVAHRRFPPSWVGGGPSFSG
jgi:hypothetical protein